MKEQKAVRLLLCVRVCVQVCVVRYNIMEGLGCESYMVSCELSSGLCPRCGVKGKICTQP